MRFGTRTEFGRRWMAKGYRPSGRQQIGYDYGYLSVAINPLSGKTFMLILPDMRTASFQLFVDEFQQVIPDKVCLITDGAASHRSTTIEVGKRLELEYLPAYSPQLNPVERFFQELRRELKNQVFDSYEAVEAAVVEAVKPYFQDPQRVKRLTAYPWLQNAPT